MKVELELSEIGLINACLASWIRKGCLTSPSVVRLRDKMRNVLVAAEANEGNRYISEDKTDV
jgi:hypothetical protein